MTPKEKAKELMDNYRFIQIPNYTSMFEVKQCALIVVDEILFVVKNYNDTQAEVTYWNEVKQEIKSYETIS
jgi:hypothetical protein